MARRPSMQELIRRRGEDGFVGRQPELSAFRDNLRTTPEDPAHRFVFHVHGVSGVGKTSLVRQFEQAAREAGALTAYVDEDVHGVLDAMESVAAQLAQQGAQLKEFDKLLDRYRQRRHEVDSAVAVPDPGPDPGSRPSATSAALATAGVAGLELIPGVGTLASRAVDPAQLAAGMDRWRAELSARLRSSEDVQLVLSPVRALTPVFLAGLESVAERAPWLALFFDTYERTGPVLDAWLHAVATTDRYGGVPANTLLTLSGQQPPDPARWADASGYAALLPLALFTEAETRQLLAAKGVTDERVVEVVLRLSGGLPVLTSMLAGARPEGPGDIGDPSGTAVERFLKWIDDPERRAVAQAAAFPLELDEDTFRAATGEESGALYGWLRSLPFVRDRSGRAQYHDVVRDTMLRFQRNQSPQRWYERHRMLAAYFAGRTGDARDWKDERWRELRRLETYHLLCADPRGHLPRAVRDTARVARHDVPAARSWGGTLARAGTETADALLAEWSVRVAEALSDDERGEIALCGLLLDEPVLGTEETVGVRAQRGWARIAARTELREARLDFDEALALDPEKVEAYRGRARVLHLMGRYGEALDDYDRALELAPDSPQLLTNRGLSVLELGRTAEAVTDFTRSLALRPGNAWTLSLRGHARCAMGRHEQALPDLTAVLRQDPDNLVALRNRAHALSWLRRYQAAGADLDRAWELGDRTTWTVAARMRVLQGLGRATEARELGGHALEDTEERDHVARSELLRAAGRPQEALAEFDEVLSADPGEPDALAGRANCLLALGRYAEAIEDFSAAIDRAPGEFWYVRRRARACRLAGRWDEALADADLLLSLDPDALDGLCLRAELLEELGRTEEALEVLCRAVEVHPDAARALLSRAAMYIRTDRFDEALADAERARETEPESARAHSVLTSVHRHTGRLDEALRAADRLVELEDGAWTRHSRALVHWYRGEVEQALAEALRAVELDDQDPEYLSFLAACRLRLSGPAAARDDAERAAALAAEPRWQETKTRALAQRVRALVETAQEGVSTTAARAHWRELRATADRPYHGSPADRRALELTACAALADWPGAQRALAALLGHGAYRELRADLDCDLRHLAAAPGADADRLTDLARRLAGQPFA